MTADELEQLIDWSVRQSIIARRLTDQIADSTVESQGDKRLREEMLKQAHTIWVAHDKLEKTAKLLRSRLP